MSVLKVAAAKPAPEAIERAVHALGRGEAVLLPFEWGYGLVTCGGRPALELVLDAASLRARAGALPRLAATLADRLWPGPLVLELATPGGNRAFLAPGSVVAREVVRRASSPLGLEVLDAREATDALARAPRATLALDAGAAPLPGLPTRVRVASGASRPEVTAEGLVSRAAVARALARTILFVCTGNTCRSPMAEGIFRARLARRLGVAERDLEGAGFSVRSAGTSAMNGGPAADQAIQTMAERGIDIASHRSRPLTPALADEAEAIFVMASSHARAIEEWFPEALPKVRLIDPDGVPDPVGQSVERYRETADVLTERIERALDGLLAEEPGPAP